MSVEIVELDEVESFHGGEGMERITNGTMGLGFGGFYRAVVCGGEGPANTCLTLKIT